MQLPIAYDFGRCDEEDFSENLWIWLKNCKFEFKKIEQFKVLKFSFWDIKDEILNNLDLGVVLNLFANVKKVAVSKF